MMPPGLLFLYDTDATGIAVYHDKGDSILVVSMNGSKFSKEARKIAEKYSKEYEMGHYVPPVDLVEYKGMRFLLVVSQGGTFDAYPDDAPDDVRKKFEEAKKNFEESIEVILNTV